MATSNMTDGIGKTHDHDAKGERDGKDFSNVNRLSWHDMC